MSLDLARNQLAYADLKADRAGVVSALPVEVGQVVTAGQLVARVAQLDSLEAQVSIPEQKLEAVRSAHAEASVWGTSGAPLQGEAARTFTRSRSHLTYLPGPLHD